MLYLAQPPGFTAQVHCVGCYLEHQGRILLLRKPDNHPLYPGQWGTVAGKFALADGRPIRAAAREIAEETGNHYEPELLELLDCYYVRHPQLDFSYTLYRLPLQGAAPHVTLSSEHVGYAWLEPLMALDLDLIMDEDEVIRRTYRLT